MVTCLVHGSLLSVPVTKPSKGCDGPLRETDREHHKLRVLQKMRMKNNTELVAYAMKYQLIDARAGVPSS